MGDMCLFLKVQGGNFGLAHRYCLVCTFFPRTKFFLWEPVFLHNVSPRTILMMEQIPQVLMFFSIFDLVRFTGDGDNSLVGQIPTLEGEEGVCGAHHVYAGVQWGTVSVYQGESFVCQGTVGDCLCSPG